ncbi:MAG: adenylate/guanylate cyclase domain-containing protein [Alphaproteobacteria bacterium]|nr:adenylate/guanylate cyclase domain-containing protein [Alphaproteobacteria bacterium]MDP6566658.1 adenylate/guanylate cyclase domain-containing protein [Alphaproteobacteria bacterium]MDP6812022.1 adenylate/guanylate cyclase domain-containing protein [Alphaproteobacteria bacterium]
MQREQRRLAAIVAADVAGYSRLVGQDEEGTLRILRDHRAELIDPLIEQHGGRIANTAGDSLLLEFPSAVDAVRCAIAFQAGMAGRNAETAATERVEFRIGINVGDVIAEGDDLLGDGVNVAARLERLADPGGICISRATRDQVRDRLDVALDDMGEVEVKNISRRIRVFRVLAEGEEAAEPAARTPSLGGRTESGQPVDQAVVDQPTSQSGGGGKRLDRDLEASGLIMLFIAPGMALLGWFISLKSEGALLPLLGVAALIVCIAIGLLAASKIIARRYREDDASATEQPKA